MGEDSQILWSLDNILCMIIAIYGVCLSGSRALLINFPESELRCIMKSILKQIWNKGLQSDYALVVLVIEGKKHTSSIAEIETRSYLVH